MVRMLGKQREAGGGFDAESIALYWDQFFAYFGRPDCAWDAVRRVVFAF
jgi:hypothetical protein